MASVNAFVSEKEVLDKNSVTNTAAFLSNKNYWACYFLIVAICVGGIGYFGEVAHYEVPPLCDFVDPSGNVIIPAENIKQCEEIFHLRGLMSYGSFLGDGSERGPDFTAEELHQFALGMIKHYSKNLPSNPKAHEIEAVRCRTRIELRNNAYNATDNVIVLNTAQVAAYKITVKYYLKEFADPKLYGRPYIAKHSQVRDLASFFVWGAWLSAAGRPGELYSYTHNWPHEPLAGNQPTPAVILWSTLSVGVLFMGLMITLYIWGQLKHENDADDGTQGQPLTTQDLETGVIRPTQQSCYK